MLLKNMIYNGNSKKENFEKVFRKCVVNILQKLIIVSISMTFAFTSFATNNGFNEAISNPANSDEESINANKYIYRTYDSETKKKIDDNIIEYDDIEELIHNYNPNVMSMWNSYKNDETAVDIHDDYMEAYDNLMASGDSSDNDTVRARMYAQAYSMKLLADNNVNDNVVNFWQNQIDETKLYLSAKKTFINYFIANYNYLIAKENEQETKRIAENSKTKYQVGVDTEISYLQAKKNADDAVANFALAESNKNNAEKNIKVICGKPTSNDIKIGSEPSVDILKINSINLEEDIKKAVENNINMKIYKRAFKNATTDEIEKHYEILINYANEEITNNVKSLYNTLQNQNVSLATRTMSNILLSEELNKANGDFSSGKISASELATAGYNDRIAKYQVEIQKLNVLSAYEDYIYAVNKGIASAILS